MRPREGEVVDGLVELLIQVTHRITVKAERRVVEELVEEAREVRGKAGILFKVAEAAVGRPDGVVREVIFPVVGEHTFEALVREARALGTRSRRVHTAVRASYGSYYRRMMPKLLAALDFRSNNGTHRPLLDALDAIRRAEGEGRQYFRVEEIAIEGVIRPKWRDIVVEDAPGGGQRVNRINYEICVLQTLRERLRCKEVWVAAPIASATRRGPAGRLRRAPGRLLRAARPAHRGAGVHGRARAEMAEALRLDRGMPRNPGAPRPASAASGRGQPARAAARAAGLGALKVELGRRWPMTGLLDLLKEADLRIGFTDAFTTAAAREATDRDEVRRRLLLCLYGLGTNAGLKRLAVGRHGFSYKELLHAAALHRRRRPARRDPARGQRDAGRAPPPDLGRGHDGVRLGQQAFRRFRPEPDDRVARPLWRARRHDLLARRARLGVHPLAAAALLVVRGRRHDRGRAAPRHRDGGRAPVRGQPRAERGGVRLLPAARLPAPAAAEGDRGAAALLARGGAVVYPNLACILARPIDWDLIEQQYDEMVRYATAMAERIADPRRSCAASREQRPAPDLQGPG